MWTRNDSLNALFEHRYLVRNANETFDFVRTTLEAEEYLDNNHKMVHDYLHYMIMDLLDHEQVSYISKNEIKEYPPILELFNGLTPDLIVQSSMDRKTSIIDIYSDSAESTVLSQKKSKYKSLSFQFDFRVVTSINFIKQLSGILSQKSIAYLSDHFASFYTEYIYWRACVKIRSIIRNDVVNKPIIDINVSSIEKRFSFISALTDRAGVLLNSSGI